MEQILIIEPNYAFAQEIIHELTQNGYVETYHLQSGDEALSYLKDNPVDIVIQSNNLGDYLGLSWAEKLSQTPLNFIRPMIIMLWIHPFPLPQGSELSQNGIIKLIEHPIEFENLIETLNEMDEQENVDLLAEHITLNGATFPRALANIFIESGEHIFSTQLATDTSLGNMFFKREPFCHSDVTSKMLVKGCLSGTVCLSFEKQLALKAASTMLMEEITTLGQDLTDCIGEIVNMLVGHSKRKFSELDLSFHYDIPSVFLGKQVVHQKVGKVPCLVIPFQTEHGQFFIEICAEVHQEEPSNA